MTLRYGIIVMVSLYGAMIQVTTYYGYKLLHDDRLLQAIKQHPDLFLHLYTSST